MKQRHSRDGKSILVTGGNGWLGGSVIARLDNDLVTSATRHESPPEDHNGVRQMCIRSDGSVNPSALEGYGAIINCAGNIKGDKALIDQANITYPVTLARAAKAAGVRRFVQLSTFSVYGQVTSINSSTPERPQSDYGFSKLEADRRLSELQDDQFSVMSLRVPFLFSRENPAHLGKLIALMRHIPVFPLPQRMVERSMLSYPDAAYLLEKAVFHSRNGIVCAADKELFSIRKLNNMMQKEEGKATRLAVAPDMLFSWLYKLAPSASASLFSSSILNADCNWAANFELPNGLNNEILHILRNSDKRKRRS